MNASRSDSPGHNTGMCPKPFLCHSPSAVILVALLCLSWTTCGLLGQSRGKQPNIIFLLADNLGYGDLSSYGSEGIATPVIDRLAVQGVKFRQFYVAHTVCSPSRAAFLTGRQPYRVGITDVLRPDGPLGLPADEVTLAELLRQAGYATACIGKWHLGDKTEFLPTQHGFDHYFGIPYSMDMLPHVLYRNGKIIEHDTDVTDITRRYTDEAIQFVELNRERPFFLYFAETIPHPPLTLPEQDRTPGTPIYVDAVQHLDQQIGRLLDVVDRLGLSDETLVIFTSDNGPMGRGSSGGLRGGIRDYYEGGIRVPFIARFPAEIPAGTVIETPAIAYDLLPTLTHFAGGTVPGDRVYDGQDIGRLLRGSDTLERHRPFIFVYDDLACAIRDGRWKLHVAERGRKLPSPMLYDLDRDPAEAYPVNDQFPEILGRLEAVLKETQAEIPKVWTLSYPVRDPEKSPSGVFRLP